MRPAKPTVAPASLLGDSPSRGDDRQPDDAEDEKSRHLEEANPEEGEPLRRDGQQRAVQHGEYRGEDRDTPRHPQ